MMPLGSLVDAATGRTVVASLVVADRFWSRLAGLQFRRPLPPGWGLLLVPCASIHTLFLRFPVDVLALGAGGEVLAVRRKLRPWRAALFPRGARAVVEMTAGPLDVEVGTRLAFVPRPEAEPRRSLGFLNPRAG